MFLLRGPSYLRKDGQCQKGVHTRIDTAPDAWEICKKKVKINGKSLLQQHMLILIAYCLTDRREEKRRRKGKEGD